MQAFFTLLSKIQKEEFSPFYLLSGNESFYIDAILKALTNKLVNEASRDFDYTLFYGKEAQASEIVETAKRYPMLSNYNVVVVKEAQFMHVSQFDLLAAYAENPMPQSVVVLCYKNKAFDKRKKLYKAVEKSGTVLTVKPLYDNQLVPWISEQARNLKLQMDPVAVELLAVYIGANLSRLESELKKLKLVVSHAETVGQGAH
jgi:DNA polymerase-3 subunit delta